MKRFWMTAALVAGLACSGKEEPPPSPAPQDAIPLAVGNYWIYQETDDTGAVDTTDTTRVLGDTLYQGDTAYKVLGYLMGQYDTALFYYAVDTLFAVYDMDVYSLVMTVEGPLMPRFLELGQRWHVFEGETTGLDIPPFFSPDDTVKVSIWGITEDSVALSVPAGEFDPTYILHYEDTVYKNGNYMLSVPQFSWVSPGVGISKRDNEDTGADPTANLVEYHLEQ